MESVVTSNLIIACSTFWRFTQISFIALFYAIRLALLSIKRLITGRSSNLSELLGKNLADLLESLGPTFIKIGQVLSSRPDLLSPQIASPLIRLQDQVAPVDALKIPVLIEKAYGSPLDQIFDYFDFEPISAASVAQVHRARLKDGRDVAVKIRKPNIVSQVTNDLRFLRLIARVLGLLPFMRTVPVLELVDELAHPIRMQLDFKLEAENNRRFRQNFAGVEYIKFPEIVDTLCVESVLVMEFLDNLNKVTSTEFTAKDRKVAALAGLRALYKMVFTDGFIHADMHPGNVFIRQWGEFVILDTGLVARLGDSDQKDFVNFFFGLVNNDGKECARIIYDNATYRAKSCDRDGFEEAMVDLIARHSSLKSNEFEVANFVYQLIETQRHFGIRGSTKFIMTVLSMVVFEGICKQLYPECDFQSEARGFLIISKYRRSHSMRVLL